jgi:hypothetical protein
MLVKLLAYALVATAITRLVLGARWKGLSQWFHRLVDLALVSLAIALVLNLVLLALRRG